MTHRLFITSSGTEIGKTFVTAALIAQLRKTGVRVAAYKPILSGFEEAEASNSDTGVLLSALGRDFSPDSIDHMTPWRFKAALSPDMAAAREGRDIPFDEVARFTATAFAGTEDAILMEGVGGLMAPIGREYTVIDWIAVAKIPALLVVGGYLGTISHTLTAVAVLAARDIPLAGIIISARGELPVPPQETAEAIARFAPGVPIAILPDLGDAPDAWAKAPDLLTALGFAHSPA